MEQISYNNISNLSEKPKISDYEKQRFEECFIDEEFICTPVPPMR